MLAGYDPQKIIPKLLVSFFFSVLNLTPISTFLKLNTLMRESRLEEIVDKACAGIIPESLVAVLEIAVKCTEANPDDRPSMNVVLHMLEEGIMTPCPSDCYESYSEC